MRSSQNVARYLFGVVLAIAALGSTARGQVTNVWSTLGPNIPIASLAIDPKNSNNIYVATQGGVFKSTDGGASWTNTGLSNAVSLVIDFVNPNTIYVGTFSSGIVYAPGGAFLFKSTDGAVTWSNASSPIDFDISLLVMDPSSSKTLYAGSAIESAGAGGIKLWKTKDAGATWSGGFTGSIGLYPFGMAINPLNSQIVYAPGENWSADGFQVVDSGVFKSADGGSTWHPTGLNNAFIQSVAIDPFNPNILYAGTSNWTNGRVPYRGLLKSTDAGATWFPINNGLTDLLNARSAVRAIVIDHHNPNVVYVGTGSRGVFRTTDGGANWTPLNDGLTDLQVQALVLAKDNSRVLYAGTASGVFRMVDNITLPSTKTIDDPQFFVRQQYLDFLNREAEPEGLQFYLDILNGCNPNDSECINYTRAALSANFFRSPEFRGKGNFVLFMYMVSLGQRPAAPTELSDPNKIERPGYQEFLTDLQALSDPSDDPAAAEQRKVAFADAWMQRPEIIARYGNLNNSQFVQKLFETAGLTIAGQDWVSELNSGTKTRAQVVRQFAERQEVYDNFFKQAFVTMEYFGYLRRAPENCHDINNWGPTQDPSQCGYIFHNNRFNIPGVDPDLMQNIIVRGFIESPEYRQRF